MIAEFLSDETGVADVEFAIILALVALAGLGALNGMQQGFATVIDLFAGGPDDAASCLEIGAICDEPI